MDFQVNKLKHVAIIMDGNGRWAQNRAHRRVWGHVRGSSVVSNIVEKADDMGVKALTLYAFSTENWGRPPSEIRTLFLLLKKFLIKERNKVLKNNIKFNIIGDISKLPKDTVKIIDDLKRDSKDNTGLKLTFAFGYGGRAEIISAVNKLIAEDIEVTEESISNALHAPELGDVDLMIRTGGDQRISNFLLWQIAYGELYFTETMWPNFTCTEFEKIIMEVEKRERRFGQVTETESLAATKTQVKNNFRLIN
ncbi:MULTISPECIES: polyprenyl diphosphate synthase [Halobacteriovorax]|uniref:Isoprenyl transferase n=1 Tax=Halobacteriovorax vibrionivorans TaxID=2152716 RepID=A0ABY0IGU6_9BACT|nr:MULTISPECIES: polyprenyl diphosphate synthase [Halobacteriovorax]AYF43267.1 di-trans,poly-cis-decaprenylcistransferase [Halobacteriovorax sp. BALOs_7]RZF22157.1 di-trans,poly-cis-decaprenylcistransferase [Halobacteriovorax vibrionivorans]TGD47143.1 di-trans,poly-cis-decaprenylcistransferase [Halobacteriovorax sp. Y22]